MGRNFLLIGSNITHFGNIPLCSQQNCYTLNSVQISFHADLYIIIDFRRRLLPPHSQFRQSNTWSCKQFTTNTER